MLWTDYVFQKKSTCAIKLLAGTVLYMVSAFLPIIIRGSILNANNKALQKSKEMKNENLAWF